MLLCPDCNHDLVKREKFDHCSFCGGTFFDRLEINRLPYSEALTISAEYTSSSKTPLDGSRNCPKCNGTLERLAGESIPSYVFAFTCPLCSGKAYYYQLKIITGEDSLTTPEYSFVIK